ncbi:hypothetical protein IV203_013201 [Nitzschia inconspicua]|uniref:Transmembrane protein n=1 Tax=Nitzschia inconspicua TaxID=303405 RepID=A0A9K3M6J8_9STRA|nr:hypothetical protein IV203_013201 [Nitzschia inconspicua]
MESPREQLDRLFACDAAFSLVFGLLALLAPHGVLSKIAGGYNHSVHEAFRLYGCLRLSCGWIVWHARPVDDGRFRKHVCEALFVCYVLQTLAVIRAQFTDRYSTINWIAIILLSILAAAYGSFRFRKGGNLIKIYELPTGANLM